VALKSETNFWHLSIKHQNTGEGLVHKSNKLLLSLKGKAKQRRKYTKQHTAQQRHEK
jgi:hypothetical protein